MSDPTLGSASASVNLNGLVTASQLYSPYGSVRYTSGILPTDYGFTHQRSDAATGLDDYGARDYDPVAGQFTSADTTLAGGLNRYAYVAGNPESFVDPSGHHVQACDIGLCGGEDDGWYGGVTSNQGGNTGDSHGVGGGGGNPPSTSNEPNEPNELNKPITNPNDPAYGMEPPRYLGSPTETSETEFNDAEAEHVKQVGEVNQEEHSQHDGSSTRTGDGNGNSGTSSTVPRDGGTSDGKLQSTPVGGDPEQASADLAAMRQDLGMGEAGSPGGGTLAKLEVGDQSFYGINAHGQPVNLTVNPISSTHAETDVFQQASNAGVSGGDGNLYVDRDLCGACGRSGAVRSMARQLGLGSLQVFTPSFPDGILWLLE